MGIPWAFVPEMLCSRDQQNRVCRRPVGIPQPAMRIKVWEGSDEATATSGRRRKRATKLHASMSILQRVYLSGPQLQGLLSLHFQRKYYHSQSPCSPQFDFSHKSARITLISGR